MSPSGTMGLTRLRVLHSLSEPQWTQRRCSRAATVNQTVERHGCDRTTTYARRLWTRSKSGLAHLDDDLAGRAAALDGGDGLAGAFEGIQRAHVGVDEAVLDDVGDLGERFGGAFECAAAKVHGGGRVRGGDDPGPIGHQVGDLTQGLTADEVEDQIHAIGGDLADASSRVLAIGHQGGAGRLDDVAFGLAAGACLLYTSDAA